MNHDSKSADIDYDPEDYCDECGAEMDYVDCYACGGMGFVEVEDGDEECSECDGDGGYYECTGLPHNDMTPADHATLRADFERSIYEAIDKEPEF